VTTSSTERNGEAARSLTAPLPRFLLPHTGPPADGRVATALVDADCGHAGLLTHAALQSAARALPAAGAAGCRADQPRHTAGPSPPPSASTKSGVYGTPRVPSAGVCSSAHLCPHPSPATHPCASYVRITAERRRTACGHTHLYAGGVWAGGRFHTPSRVPHPWGGASCPALLQAAAPLPLSLSHIPCSATQAHEPIHAMAGARERWGVRASRASSAACQGNRLPAQPWRVGTDVPYLGLIVTLCRAVKRSRQWLGFGRPQNDPGRSRVI
jgi:hypothetical protein